MKLFKVNFLICKRYLNVVNPEHCYCYKAYKKVDTPKIITVWGIKKKKKITYTCEEY